MRRIDGRVCNRCKAAVAADDADAAWDEVIVNVAACLLARQASAPDVAASAH